jgi:cellulose biosynthesis protein BcsQ
MIYSFLNQNGGVGKTTLSLHVAGALARSIILASDVVVIPVQPSPFDIWAAAETVELIKEARIYNENLKAVIAINCTIVNMAIGRAMCVKRWPA